MDIVVVPHRPGPLIRPAAVWGRDRDDLDDLIDDLFPDSDEGPGAFDAGLVVVGGALLGWGGLADGPGVATVVGAIALGLGGILPTRAVWRRWRRREADRRRAALLAQGLPLQADHPVTARLVAAYEALLTITGSVDPELGGSAVAAAHTAVTEAATLLRGRPPRSAAEEGYVGDRAQAIEEVTTVLGDRFRPVPAAGEVEGAFLAEARSELDAIGGVGSLARLDALASEARLRRGGS